MTQTITVEAQLGPAYTGQTASYKIYNVDGTQYANWTSSGVAELGTTGTYQAFSVSAPDAGGVVHWSFDGGSTDLGIVGEIKAAAPTAAAIRGEMDSNSTQLAAIVADTNELQGDWANGGRLDLILDARASQTSVDTIDSIVDSILVDTGTDIPAAISGLNDLSQADVRSAVGLASANLDTQLDAIPTAAEINAEVVDALSTDTYAQPSSPPAATSSLAAKINWLFTLAKNKILQTEDTQTLRNDGDTADIATAAVSDDGTTATRDKWQ